jgi:hypothetical protein
MPPFDDLRFGKQVYIKTPYVSNIADQNYNMLWLLVFLTVHGFGVRRFKVQGSAQPLTAEAASLIEKETPALRSHIRVVEGLP